MKIGLKQTVGGSKHMKHMKSIDTYRNPRDSAEPGTRYASPHMVSTKNTEFLLKPLDSDKSIGINGNTSHQTKSDQTCTHKP